MKKTILLVLQALVSVALLAWIFGKEDFRTQALHLVQTADRAWLLAGLAAAGLSNLLGVIRWGLFLRVVGIRISAWETLRLSWIGLFFNNFLVGVVGGDAVKVVWLCAKGQPKFPALLSVLMDRMSGLGAMVVLSFGFILARLDWLLQSPVVAGFTHFVFIYLSAVVAGVALSFVLAMKGVSDRLPAKFPGREKILEFTAVYFQFVKCWKLSLGGALISFGMLMLYFLTFYCSARSFGLNVPVIDFCAIMPAIDIISALPVSLGGFGVREKLFSTLLGDLCGTPAALAVSISLGGAFLVMVWGLAGAFLLPSYRRAAGGRITV